MESAIYEFDDFRIDAGKRMLWNGGKPLGLTPKVFDTLFYLVKNAGKTIGKDELMAAIWSDTIVEENNLNKNISALRQLLGEKPGEHRFIVTVPGKGYRFVASVVACSVNGIQHSGVTPSDGMLPALIPSRAAEPEPGISLDSARSSSQRGLQLRSSALNRFFLLFGTTPHKRWAVMQVRILIWCVLIGVLGWIFSTKVSNKWGVTLFLVELVCIAFLMVLASFLLYVSALQLESLPEQVQKTALWIRGLIIGLVVISWMMAGCVFDSHLDLAALLALCATAGGLKYTMFKTLFDHAILADLSPRNESRLSKNSPLSGRPPEN